MNKALIAYFSATGMTARVAQTLAEMMGADMFEIKPRVPYTMADLDWRDATSRSTLEMKDAGSRPAIAEKCGDMDDYDTVFVGFPIWWYVAPTIISTFLESYDLTGKTIISFATSGGSGMGKTDEILRALCPDRVSWREGKVLKSNATGEELAAWVSGLKL